MKLRATTLLYIITNIYLIIFRTVQITAMTTADSAFLKDGLEAANIIGTIIGILLIISTFVNALGTRKAPENIEPKGILPAVMYGIVGFCFVCSGVASLFDNLAFGFGVLFVLSLAAAFTCVLYLLSALRGYHVPKFAPLLLIILWLGEFVFSYLFYTTRALRVRTVYETVAMVAIILFFLSLGKAHSGVKTTRNIHLLYPLGLVASSLCFVSIIPEFIALILGFSEKISVSCVSQIALLGAGIFTAFISLYCFRPKRNHPEKFSNMPLISDDVVHKTSEDEDTDAKETSETLSADDGSLDFYIPEDTDNFK